MKSVMKLLLFGVFCYFAYHVIMPNTPPESAHSPTQQTTTAPAWPTWHGIPDF